MTRSLISNLKRWWSRRKARDKEGGRRRSKRRWWRRRSAARVIDVAARLRRRSTGTGCYACRGRGVIIGRGRLIPFLPPLLAHPDVHHLLSFDRRRSNQNVWRRTCDRRLEAEAPCASEDSARSEPSASGMPYVALSQHRLNRPDRLCRVEEGKTERTKRRESEESQVVGRRKRMRRPRHRRGWAPGPQNHGHEVWSVKARTSGRGGGSWRGWMVDDGGWQWW